MLELQDEVRLEICTKDPERRYIGHSHIHIVNDGKLCQHIAKTSYVKELGARSINNAVGNLRRHFVQEYSKTNVEVGEVFNKGPLHRYTFRLQPVSETVEEISVFRDGVTNITG